MSEELVCPDNESSTAFVIEGTSRFIKGPPASRSADAEPSGVREWWSPVEDETVVFLCSLLSRAHWVIAFRWESIFYQSTIKETVHNLNSTDEQATNIHYCITAHVRNHTCAILFIALYLGYIRMQLVM